MEITNDKKWPEAIVLREQEAKLQGLGKDRSKEQAELARATERYLQSKRSKGTDLETEAAALLRGSPDSEDVARSIAAIEHKIRVIDFAIEKQQAAVTKARRDFTAVLCEANKSKYVAIERRIVAAVQELAEANQAEVDLFAALVDAGVSAVPFRPMRLTGIGSVRDPNSRASLHRREVAEYCPEAVVLTRGGGSKSSAI